jgi:hypothetical protein
VCLSRELVLENPRPYDVVTLFTVKRGCDRCDEIAHEYQGVAYSYKQDETETPAFMGVIYYTSDPKMRETFEGHNFKTVPYLATSKGVQKRDPDSDFYKTEDKWLIRTSDVFDSHILLEFVNKRLGNYVSLSIPFHVLFIKNLILFSVVGTALAVFVKIREHLIN